jgi:prepilin-type processing-associated H-X9-DG protein
MHLAKKAFTLVELLAIVAVVFILVVLFLPGPLFPKRRGHVSDARIRCVLNLKQVGLAFAMWADDHNNLYPMRALTNANGGLLFADETNGFRYFQVMSNELSTPKILVCPADTRIAVTDFGADFNGASISYFLGLDADATRPTAFLSGDRNITNGQKPLKGMLEVRTNQNIGWTKEIHGEAGNVGLVDGSVQQCKTPQLNLFEKMNGLATNRLLLPP